ncbi:DUF397 domain-containing protein [Actinomadura sp. 9N407]|uniref:DUF397 domain-containing protein n=1 Tax=Actinomadura sp. 9N407 TaxID=3375154 RepID=UPI003792408D
MSLLVDASQARWRKSRRSSSTGSDCVEIADLGEAIAFRDSKDPTGPNLMLARTAWQDLSRRMASGELDL